MQNAVPVLKVVPGHADPVALSATEQARLVRSGEISSLELVNAHIERIEQVNPSLNAVVARRYDDARAEAREADCRRSRGEALGPLHGVPVTIKDSLDVAGMASTFGIPSRASTVATADEKHAAKRRSLPPADRRSVSARTSAAACAAPRPSAASPA